MIQYRRRLHSIPSTREILFCEIFYPIPELPSQILLLCRWQSRRWYSSSSYISRNIPEICVAMGHTNLCFESYPPQILVERDADVPHRSVFSHSNLLNDCLLLQLPFQEDPTGGVMSDVIMLFFQLFVKHNRVYFASRPFALCCQLCFEMWSGASTTPLQFTTLLLSLCRYSFCSSNYSSFWIFGSPLFLMVDNISVNTVLLRKRYLQYNQVSECLSEVLRIGFVIYCRTTNAFQLSEVSQKYHGFPIIWSVVATVWYA